MSKKKAAVDSNALANAFVREYVRKLEADGESFHWVDIANAIREVRAALDELRRAEGFIR